MPQYALYLEWYTFDAKPLELMTSHIQYVQKKAVRPVSIAYSYCKNIPLLNLWAYNYNMHLP